MSVQAKENEKREFPRYRPLTDIVEAQDGFYMYMDMPGATKESLVLDLNANELAVRAKAVYPKTNEKALDLEFGDGEYFRTFILSDIVDRNRIKAVFRNGVLELHLPKVEKAQPKRIEITSD